MTATSLEWALAHAARGFRVIPIPAGEKGPKIPDWRNAATRDPTTIARWFSGAPQNIGLVMGGPARLIAIDLDGSDGMAWWTDLEAAHGAVTTLTTVTGSGNSLHKFFRVPVHLDFAALSDRHPAPHVDPKCNGQVVAPGSVHPSGGIYAWLDPAAEIAEIPIWLYMLLVADRVQPERVNDRVHIDNPPRARRIELARAHLRDWDPAVEGVGGDNHTFAAACAVVRGFDLSTEDALAAFDEFNARCVPPWPEKTLVRKLVQAAEKSTDPWRHIIDIVLMNEELTNQLVTQTEAPQTVSIVWIHGPDAARPLTPPRWIVPELQICPGRPTMIAGFGASGKTLLTQSLVLSFVAGKPIWHAFPAGLQNGTMRHLDHEQGTYATLRRYQRLATGLGIDLRDLGSRFGVACFPEIRLNSPNAKTAYALACAGADIVMIDALRGATPGEDENDSKIRTCIDVLGWVSEKIGTSFILIHHAGKVQQADKRTGPRGSSAIFDGCGCVLQVTAEDRNDPKLVEQTKTAAEAESGLIPSFALSIDDAEAGGLRVNYRAIQTPRTAADRLVEVRARVLEWIETHPGCTKNELRAMLKGQHEIRDLALEKLLQTGDVINRSADGKKWALYTKNNDTGRLQ